VQYFAPGGDQFVGDCMPWYHDGTFHLFYLLDEGHHQGLGGLGGHQWAHASTRDLVRWQHHPLALPLAEPWEGSICTGSALHHAGVFHAFYAVRARDYSQHLAHAVSDDGITFRTPRPHPFLSPPAGYAPNNLRDPCVFAGADGQFHLLVTSRLDPFPLHERGGCLLHLVSPDLWQWRVVGPLLVPGGAAGYQAVPECPDYFVWNGWHYLLFGQGLQTRYRVARDLGGPWRRPPRDTLDTAFCAVMKTAPFGDGRRIGVGWAGPRRDDRDDGPMLWGGVAVFRELVQYADGTLGTRFVPELMPATGDALPLTVEALTPGCSGDGRRVQLRGWETQEVAALDSLPRRCHIRCRVEPVAGAARFGLGLRGSGPFAASYDLAFTPATGEVALAQERLAPVDRLDQPFTLDVVLHDDVIDVCVDGRQCLINRLPALQGERLFLFCEHGEVTFDEIAARPLLP
jgi:beta-fructofuranosidase